MVRRSAFAQLRRSPLLLAATVLGMGLSYLAPPLLVLGWPLHGSAAAAALGLAAWGAMAALYAPTLRYYGRPALEGLALPAVAGLYLLMTLYSALDHWRGRGPRWKGREYRPIQG